MMMEPFSVAMCVYCKDDPAWFGEAVESILNQSVKPDEVVLVVDGPVPQGLEEKLAEYENDPLFHIIRLPENQGHGKARSIGLNNCRNELVALMDADDLSVPTRFERQLAAFQQDPSVSIVGGNIAEFVGETTNVVGYRIVPENDAQIAVYLKNRCPFNQMTVMFRRSHVQDVGGYQDWYCNEDYFLWLRMYLAGKHFRNLPEVLVKVRIGEDMYRRRGGWKYFCSEARLQRYMFNNQIIGAGRYAVNISKRFIVQVLLPNRLRGWVFQRFARKNYDGTKKV